MELKLSTWVEVEAYLKRYKSIIVPIGSTEQHGPMGLIGTDTICPEIVAKGIAQKMDVLIAPTIQVGMSQHHMDFKGSMTLRPTTLISMIRDIIQSLIRNGFEYIFFLNGHGGNVASIEAAFAEVYAENSLNNHTSDFKLKLSSWYHSEKLEEISKKYFGEAEGGHATPSEVSLSYYAYPDHVKSAELNPQIAPNGEIHDAVDYRKNFPDGRIGSNSALASIEIGKKIFEAAVADKGEEFLKFDKSRK